MDMKYVYIAEYRAKIDEENVLVIHVASNDENMEGSWATAVMDGAEVPVSVVRRDTMRSRFCYRTRDVSFSCEYQFSIKVTDNFKKLDFILNLREELETEPATLTVSGKRFRKSTEKIAGCVDFIKCEKDKVTIEGWMADKKPVEVKVYQNNSPLDCDIAKMYRKDIREYYQEGEYDLPAGYIIEMKRPKDDKICIKYVTEDKETVHHVNLKYATGKKNYKFVQNIRKAWEYNKKYGFKVMTQKAYNKLTGSNIFDYDGWIKRHEPTKEELASQRTTKFDKEPLFSIVVPVYNPKDKYFIEMVKSVVNQTYSKWELCISDGGKSVKKILDNVVGNDPRVKYCALGENLGISENTNKALELATGDFIVLGDHDDILRPNALFECAKAINENIDVDVVYSDEDKHDSSNNKRTEPNFKPDYSPDFLRVNNYICHLFVFSRELFEKVGKFRSEFDGSQDYDMILRCCEHAKNIIHIPKILYSWRMHSNSTAGNPESKKYAYDAGRRAVAAHLDRVNLKGEVTDIENYPGRYRVKYDIIGNPKISILIPNKDHVEDLDKCIRSVIGRQDYTNYEIIVIENNSTENETFEYYKKIEQEFECLKVVYWDAEFNYSKINNFGVKYATGEYLLLLNNDTEMIGTDCLRELLSYGQRPDVGIVGAKLLYEDETVQHAGVIIGLAGLAGHAFVNNTKEDGGYQLRANMPQNLSAVTAACFLTRRSIYDEVGGLEETLQVAFNDVDYCLKVRDKGYLVVYNPYALLHHYESKSRGYEDSSEKIERFGGEALYMDKKWNNIIRNGDPYYNVNLTLHKSDFSLRE